MLLTLLTMLAVETGRAAAAGDLRAGEAELVQAIAAELGGLGVSADGAGRIVVREPGPPPAEAACSVVQYRHLVTPEEFDEVWPGGEQGERTIRVEGEIWTRAIQAALDERGGAFVPGREKPYYVDGPVVMRSGTRLHLADGAELRLKPGANCCMVRNEHLVNGHDGPLQLAEDPDRDIEVSGGIWTTLATSERQDNGNVMGWADASHALRSHGVLLFSNVENLLVHGVTVRECRPHAVQLSNCRRFVVDGVRFENHRRDGIHVNGPAAFGVIRGIRNARGVMGDDMIALNAWDWKNTSMTFGPIHHVLVEDIDGAAGGENEAGRERRAEIRLLSGTKRYDNGAVQACDIEHCVLRGIAGIRTFKMYDQPNLELGRDNDFAEPIGGLRSLWFSGLRLERPTGAPVFQIALNGEGIAIRDVALGFEPFPADGPRFVLVQIGPMSQTYKHNPNDPNTWVEIFSPDKDCTVTGLRVEDVRVRRGAAGADGSRPVPADELVAVVAQELNPDYPATTPRGGTGRGFLK
ncbi:MAG: right-handed parallel beta-helix repeat-containing protein [Candidatus Hydrogenedentes bacterium]|nr:right-handed parallel beta-helix repeat-containing protein [Candidatus Hydrogenedentota bacterium]